MQINRKNALTALVAIKELFIKSLLGNEKLMSFN